MKNAPKKHHDNPEMLKTFKSGSFTRVNKVLPKVSNRLSIEVPEGKENDRLRANTNQRVKIGFFQRKSILNTRKTKDLVEASMEQSCHRKQELEVIIQRKKILNPIQALINLGQQKMNRRHKSPQLKTFHRLMKVHASQIESERDAMMRKKKLEKNKLKMKMHLSFIKLLPQTKVNL